MTKQLPGVVSATEHKLYVFIKMDRDESILPDSSVGGSSSHGLSWSKSWD